jgi:general L-amino acid transport system permease protein
MLIARLPIRRLRSLLWQALAAALIAALVLFIAHNAVVNMARLKINSGFAFLLRPAGFAIAQHFIPYDESSTYLAAFLVALLNTIVVAAVAIVLATLIGFVIGIARLSSNRLLALVAAAYVEFIRNVPLLLQLFYWYFAVLRQLPLPKQSLDLFHLHVAFLNSRGLVLPQPLAGPGAPAALAAFVAGVAATIVLRRWARRRRDATGEAFPVFSCGLALLLGLPLAAAALAGPPLLWDVPVLAGFNFRGGLTLNPEFVALALALSLYGAAYIAEIVRAGIAAVPSGQIEAARALGMKRLVIVRKILVPQALRIILPPLAGQYIVITKNTALAAAIAYPELMLIFAGTVLNQTGQAFEVMLITLATYLLIGLGISYAMNRQNRRLTLVTR